MLSHKKPDSVINVKVEFGEGEGKVPLDNIAKRAAVYKPKERVTYKMIKEYIEAKHGFMEIFEAIGVREHLQPFALSKIAIALAIKNKYKFTGENSDSLGLDLNRQTITGEYDLLYKKLIEQNEGRSIPEEIYFPDVLKAYLDYGAGLLEQEYKYTNDIYCHLMNLEKCI